MLITIWFILWGVLWGLYFILDGFDFGIGILLPFVAKTEEEKRILYNAMGPFWDGNEVWLITAGGVTFAAFPVVYAVMFSGLYTALMLLLFALIFRGVAFEFRGKIESICWKKMWDKAMFVGSLLPALLFGVAFANIFSGLPIDANGIVHANILQLLTPYGLAGGIFFVLLFIIHGAFWLAIRTEGEVQQRAVNIAKKLWIPLTVYTVIFLAVTLLLTNVGNNYLVRPYLIIFLFVPIFGLYLGGRSLYCKNFWLAWTGTGLLIGGTILAAVIGMFPALLPSSLAPQFSLTVFNSSSSSFTLKIMLAVALVFVPTVLVYQSWVYKTFSYKLSKKDLESEHAY